MGTSTTIRRRRKGRRSWIHSWRIERSKRELVRRSRTL